MKHLVYIMEAGDYIKVGMTSSSIKARVRQIQTGCPIAIENAKMFSFDSRQQAFTKEKELQTLFRKYHTYGEWFVRPKHYGGKAKALFGKDYTSVRLLDRAVFMDIVVHERRQKIVKFKAEQQHREITAVSDKAEVRKALEDMSMSEHIALMERNKSKAKKAEQYREYTKDRVIN